MRAHRDHARMALAIVGFKELPAEQREHIAHDNLVGRAARRVTAGLASRALHESTLSQDAHELRDVRNRKSLGRGNLGNCQTALRALTRDLQQTAQPVLFLSAEFHILIPPARGLSKKANHKNPKWS